MTEWLIDYISSLELVEAMEYVAECLRDDIAAGYEWTRDKAGMERVRVAYGKRIEIVKEIANHG